MPETREQLRLRAKRRADMENSGFVSDSEWNDYLEEGKAELHELVVDKHEDFLVRSTTFSLVANQNGYDLPSDFLMPRGVDLVSGNNTYTVRPFMFRERNRLEGWYGGNSVGYNFMYQIFGNQIWFEPAPSSSGSIKLWYVPQVERFKNDGDTLNVAYANGWERYIVLYAAIKALQKEESDVSFLMAELAGVQKKIESNSYRSPSDPKRIVDVRYSKEGCI